MSEVHADSTPAKIRELKRAADELGALATSHEASDVDRLVASKLQEHLLAMRSIEVKARKQAAEANGRPTAFLRPHQKHVAALAKKAHAVKSKKGFGKAKSVAKLHKKLSKKVAKKR